MQSASWVAVGLKDSVTSDDQVEVSADGTLARKLTNRKTGGGIALFGPSLGDGAFHFKIDGAPATAAHAGGADTYVGLCVGDLSKARGQVQDNKYETWAFGIGLDNGKWTLFQSSLEPFYYENVPREYGGNLSTIGSDGKIPKNSEVLIRVEDGQVSINILRPGKRGMRESGWKIIEQTDLRTGKEVNSKVLLKQWRPWAIMRNKNDAIQLLGFTPASTPPAPAPAPPAPVPAPAPAPAPASAGKRRVRDPRPYALCVGVDDWTRDASNMAELLTHDLNYPDSNVVTLNAGRGPTGTEVLAELGRLAATVREEDLLVIYYSGHGTRVNRGKDFAFCTKGDWLTKTELLKAINRVDAKVVIIIDACHSGQFSTAKSKSKSKAADEFDGGDLEAWFRTSGRLVMSAATAGQEAPGSSAFTHALIQAAKQHISRTGGRKLCLRPLSLFDGLNEILEHAHREDEDRPPPPRISGVDALGSFALGPF